MTRLATRGRRPHMRFAGGQDQLVNRLATRGSRPHMRFAGGQGQLVPLGHPRQYNFGRMASRVGAALSIAANHGEARIRRLRQPTGPGPSCPLRSLGGVKGTASRGSSADGAARRCRGKYHTHRNTLAASGTYVVDVVALADTPGRIQ